MLLAFLFSGVLVRCLPVYFLFYSGYTAVNEDFVTFYVSSVTSDSFRFFNFELQ